jgi:hypothetical protein
MKRIIAAALIAASTAAHAAPFESFFRAEAGLGVTNYSIEDGRWYQQGMSHDVTHVAPEWSLGLTGPIVTRGKWGVDWHADYVNLGRAAADCTCTPSDENYSVKQHKKLNVVDVDDAYFTGSGRAQGFALTIEPYYWFHGLRIGVEAGAFAYRSSWDESVFNWQVNRAVAPQNLNVGGSSYNVAPVAGVNIGNGRVSLAYRHYFMSLNSRRSGNPPLWNDADVLEVKVKF